MNPVELPITIYESNSDSRIGLRAWRFMFGEVVRSRELTWRFFVREFSTRFRQSLLGYFWILISPLATVGLFVYLRVANVLQVSDTSIPYPAHMLFSLLFWQIFTSTVTAATHSMVAEGVLLSKINFPRECLIFASVGGALFDVSIRSVLVALIFLYYGIAPRWTIAMLPIVVVLILLFAVGLGFVLSILNAFIRDIGRMLPMVLSLLFFSVPILYPPPCRWPHNLLNDFNPMSAFIIAANDLSLKGTLTHPEGMLLAGLIGVSFFLMGWRIFHLCEPFIAERI